MACTDPKDHSQVVVPAWLAKLIAGAIVTVILGAGAWAFGVSLSLERVSTKIEGLQQRLDRIESGK